MSEIVLPAPPRAGRCRIIALAALAVVVLAGGVTAPSIAAERHDRRPVRHFHHGPPAPAYGYGGPAYVQAPPPVVYAPPAYETPFSLGLSFNIH